MYTYLHRWTRAGTATAVLLLVFVTINAIAVWGIVSGRREARRAAQGELELRTRADARSLEAVLATLRADFLFLAQSPPVALFMRSLEGDDAAARRWSRLDVEGTFLLFLEARPALERLVMKDSRGMATVVAGRREGRPALLPTGASYPVASRATGGLWPFDGETVFQGTFPLEPGGGKLEVWLETSGLLAIAAPGMGEHLEIELQEATAEPPRPGELVAQVPVVDKSWDPPIEWRLECREREGELLRSVESLARSYRTTVVLNLTVMTLTLVLGALAFRHVRRAASLEAENEQEKRVRELERQLMHSERLASVGRLAAGFAHEINNPLEGMANYLSLLADDLAEGRTEGAPQLVERVRQGLERAAGVTRQVLAFSGPNKAPKDAVELAAVLRDAVGFVRSSREYRGVEIRLEAAPGLSVRGNPITLGQVFLNLLLNACQAQPEGGEVEVRLAVDGDRKAVVAVADRGPGLAEEVRDHLFEPFYSTRESTGLGLAVCHGIVADLGGEIEGRNRESGGAVFEVRLPLDEDANRQA